MADRGKSRFDRIGCAYALPMLGGEIEESHEFGSVFLQTQRCLGVFGLVGLDEQIEGLLRIFFGLRLPNVVDRGFGLWLRQVGQAIEHVHRLVLPAPLLPAVGYTSSSAAQNPHSAIPDGQLGCVHSPIFETEKNLTPALGAFTHAVLNRQKPLLATSCYSNNYKGAELVIFAAKAAVNAVCPDINDRLVIKRSVLPVIVFLRPITLEP